MAIIGNIPCDGESDDRPLDDWIGLAYFHSKQVTHKASMILQAAIGDFFLAHARPEMERPRSISTAPLTGQCLATPGGIIMYGPRRTHPWP